MTSLAKKKKCYRTALDRGGEKGPVSKGKRIEMFHKKERIAIKNSIKKEADENE